MLYEEKSGNPASDDKSKENRRKFNQLIKYAGNSCLLLSSIRCFS
jgi:hypothetical protein